MFNIGEHQPVATKNKPRTKPSGQKNPVKLPPDVLELERDDRVSFRCPPVLREAIEAYARKDHRSVSDWLVLAVNEVINRREDF